MPTLTQYRQRAAKELGFFASGTATSGSSVTVLECTTWPFQSSMDVDDEYVDKWLFRPAAAAADKVRYISSTDRSAGLIVPDKAWAAAPYNTSGESFEIHGFVEPLTELLELINLALKRCFVVVEFTFSSSDADYTRHSLATAASWLTQESWVRQVGYLTSTEDRNEVDPFRRVLRGEVISHGKTMYLQMGARATTDVIYVKALKPAYYHCAATGAAYGTQATGLALETDIAEPEEEWVAAGVLVEAWKRYGHILEAAANQRLVRERVEAASYFTLKTRQNLRVPRKTFHPVYAWGP
jgi:hypothetical protein